VIPDGTPLDALPDALRLIVNSSIPGEWEEWTRARNLPPPDLDRAVALDSIEQVLQLAESGYGLAMGRSPYIEARLQSGALVAPFGQVGPTGAAYYLCRPEGASPPASARKLARWLQGEADAVNASAT
jgi:LysR family glycine cleavage system transcriptional activator